MIPPLQICLAYFYTGRLEHRLYRPSGTTTLMTRSAAGESESQTKGYIDRLHSEDVVVSLPDQEEYEGKEKRDQVTWGKGQHDQARLGEDNVIE